jgi:hypothetical protein
VFSFVGELTEICAMMAREKRKSLWWVEEELEGKTINTVGKLWGKLIGIYAILVEFRLVCGRLGCLIAVWIISKGSVGVFECFEPFNHSPVDFI